MADGNRERKILVTGATGRQGGATARHLLRKGVAVRALTRDPAAPNSLALRELGAEVVQGDLDDRDSLDRALEGVSGVFSVQNFWETGYDREIEQGLRLADAAKDAGIEHFVYSSVGSAHRKTGLSHFESKRKIEKHIGEIGIPYTIFRPVWFMENWEGPFLRPSILAGTLALPLDADVNFQQIAVDDVGAIAAAAFEKPDSWLGRSVELASDEGTISAVVDTFSRVIGRPVVYQQVPWDEYRAAAGEEYHDMFRWFQEVGYDAEIEALRREVPQLTPFEQYLRDAGWAGAQAAAE